MSEFKSIVLSGKPVSGKSTLARALAAEFGMQHLSVGALFRAEAKEKGIPIDTYWPTTTVDDNLRADARMRRAVEGGGVVAEQRYPICDKTSALMVLVDASLQTRALRALSRGDYPGMSEEGVRHRLRIREQDEINRGIELYGILDYSDPSHYHDVVSSENLTVEEELAVVKALFEKHHIA
jgi:cytidylate kinase